MVYEFVVLGPVSALLDHVALDLGGRKPRTLLALLLLARGRALRSATLIDELWDANPPASARKTLQTYLSRLRHALAAGRSVDTGPVLETHRSGYALAVDPEAVDALRFEALYEAGRQAHWDGDPGAAARTLRDGLALWRGVACQGTLPSAAIRAHAERLEQLRLAALEARFDADLALGRWNDVVLDIDPLVAAHPLRQHFHVQRICALYGAGRQVEALAAFDEAKRRMGTTASLEPAPELVRLHEGILRHEPPASLLEASGPPKPRVTSPPTG